MCSLTLSPAHTNIKLLFTLRVSRKPCGTFRTHLEHLLYQRSSGGMCSSTVMWTLMIFSLTPLPLNLKTPHLLLLGILNLSLGNPSSQLRWRTMVSGLLVSVPSQMQFLLHSRVATTNYMNICLISTTSLLPKADLTMVQSSTMTMQFESMLVVVETFFFMNLRSLVICGLLILTLEGLLGQVNPSLPFFPLLHLLWNQKELPAMIFAKIGTSENAILTDVSTNMFVLIVKVLILSGNALGTPKGWLELLLGLTFPGGTIR